MNNNKGQTLYYFLIFVMILVISWAMMLNIAKLIRDRMTAQTLADNAALSLATHKARAMNTVAGLNYLIGTMLSLGTNPDMVQIPSYSTDLIASYITGDLADGYYSAEEDDVKSLKGKVDKVQDAQETVMKSHIAYADALIGEYLSKGYYLNIKDYPLDFTSKEKAEKLFGLKRNMKGITYLKTINSTIKDIHMVYNPYPLSSGDSILKYIKQGNPILEVLYEVMQVIDRNIGKEEHDKKPYSWYITDNEKFYKQKIKVFITKVEEDSYKPLFSKLLGISKLGIWDVPTYYSAASIYNRKGTMFPEKEGTNTGVSDHGVFIPYMIMHAQKTAEFLESLNSAKVPWYIVAGAALSILASTGDALEEAMKDEDNPIDAYNNAKIGGWGAHLVPYKTEEEENNGGSNEEY